MQAQILKADETEEYFFDEGCFIPELSNSSGDLPYQLRGQGSDQVSRYDYTV